MKKQVQLLVWVRSLLLGLGSVLFNVVQIFAILSPMPLLIASYCHGRVKGYGVGLFFLFLLILAAGFWPGIFQGSWIIYSVFFLLAILATEIVIRRKNPFQAILWLSPIFVASTLALGLGYLSFSREESLQKTLRDSLEIQASALHEQMGSQIDSPEQVALKELLESPDSFADFVIRNFITVYFSVVVLTLWLNLILFFRAKPFFRHRSKSRPKSEYGVRSLIHVKVPEVFVWPLIVCLVLAIWGEELAPLVGLSGTLIAQIGFSGTVCLAVLYFIQGLGVYIDFLANLRIWPFFKLFLLAFTALSANWLLSILGLFDLWFDWRRFFLPTKDSDNS